MDKSVQYLLKSRNVFLEKSNYNTVYQMSNETMQLSRWLLEMTNWQDVKITCLTITDLNLYHLFQKTKKICNEIATGTSSRCHSDALQWIKNSEKLTLSDMIFTMRVYKEIRVQMLRIYTNYIVGMIKSSIYGHKIKLETHFLSENIIRSRNYIKKIWFRFRIMFIFNKFHIILP